MNWVSMEAVNGAIFSTYIYPSAIDNAKVFVDGVAKLNGAIGSDCQVQHTANTSWVKHTITFKTKANFADNENLLFRLSPIVMSGNGYYVYICMPKLEVGKIATAYDANSDDMRPDYQEYRFAKNGSRNSAPALVKTDAEPSGWTTTQPTVGTLEYLWMVVAKKSATGALLTKWSKPVRITPYDGKDGENGKSPAMVYRGVYDSSKTYYGNQYRVDVVKYNGIYYVARIDAGEFHNIAPTNTSKWNNFGAQFESVATGLLLAENANIAGFIFRNNRLESSLSDANGQPNVILDGVSGNSRFSGILKASLYYGSTKKVTDASNREYQINPQIEPFNCFFIDEPTNLRFVTLPKAKDYDGLEIKIYTKQSHWTPDRWSVVKVQSTDDFYVKLGNIYNVYDAGDNKFVAALENYMTPYTNIKGTGCTMIPNVMHTFKSMNGAWFSIQGLYTGE
ncbi:hypothetical protein DW060_01160 [Leyella stercorea]|uniref:Uncharacterized protein n=1 Tax=Leyella stercorea TaxID=363265 RepID=A0A3R6I4D1_9BACT|nr:hypothetical protein DW060_01160 [Leyella stercorea]